MSDQKRKPLAILVADGFEERQLTDTQKKLIDSACQAKVIGAEGSLVHGWHQGAWGHHFMAEANLADVLSADFDGLLVPDGAQSTATLRRNPHARRFVKAFVDSKKPAAVIGEAVVLLKDAEVLAGRQVAATDAIRDEVEQGGATVVDEALVADGSLITAQTGEALQQVLRQLLDGMEPTDQDVGEAA